MEYIGISENKLKHIIGVARKCYSLSKELNMSESFCRKMFLIGYLHDVGYEFSETINDHGEVGELMLRSLGLGSNREEQKILHAIRKHTSETKVKSLEWLILTEADLSVDYLGNDVGIKDRLEDIKTRYGENSTQYQEAKELAQKYFQKGE